MKREMFGAKVYVSDQGNVVLEQEDGSLGEQPMVILHPDQVPTVIEWLQEALKEASAVEPGGLKVVNDAEA